MADVLARADTIRPGDRVYTPRGQLEGYAVERVERHEDGTLVVVYLTGRASQIRFGGVLCRTEEVLASLAPLRPDDRVRIRRDGRGRAAGPQRMSG